MILNNIIHFPSDFIFRMNLSNTTTFTLPLAVGYNYNFDVYWGDGTSDRITAYNQAEIEHTYTTNNIKTVRIRGLCECFDSQTSTTFANKLIYILNWGRVGMKFLRLSSTALISMPTTLGDSDLSISTGVELFYNCRDLQNITTDLFRNSSSIADMTNCFRQCRSLPMIPVGLFDNLTNVTNFTGVLAETWDLNSIPADLFRYNTAVTSFENAFFFNESSYPSKSSLAEIPSNIFRYNTVATNFNSTFKGQNLAVSNADIFGPTANFNTRFINQDVDFEDFWVLENTTDAVYGGTLPPLWNADYGSGSPSVSKCFGNYSVLLPNRWGHRDRTNAGDVPSSWKL